ncbi:MAG TPA: hypothetical protein VK348_15610 [Planctomycetota bacterium]|nr:hypothetical protein [Planctomycetota bacterium]
MNLVALLQRLSIYLPVLFLIAIVICGQQHETARATLQAAWRKTVRWLLYSLLLVLAMQLIEWVFIR